MERLSAILSVVVIALITVTILAWPNMWLWNNVLVGAVDGVHPIGFLQSLGITLLFNSLFKPTTNIK